MSAVQDEIAVERLQERIRELIMYSGETHQAEFACSPFGFARHGYRHWGLQMTDNTSTALITGGTSGIGLATAKKLALLGIHVLLVGRNAERGKKAIEEIRTAGGQSGFYFFRAYGRK